jgi:hypothetical protein
MLKQIKKTKEINKMIDYLKNEEISKMLEENSTEIFKKAITLGSNYADAKSSVEDNKLITHVKNDEGKIVEETRNDLSADVVVARNPEPLGELNGATVYNEWLVPKETWLKNYGVDATNQFEEYQKLGTIKALEIDDKVLKILGSTDGSTAKIAVSWSDEGMDVYKGGVLTDQGYGIAPLELKATYAPVVNAPESKKTIDSPKPS